MREIEQTTTEQIEERPLYHSVMAFNPIKDIRFGEFDNPEVMDSADEYRVDFGEYGLQSYQQFVVLVQSMNRSGNFPGAPRVGILNEDAARRLENLRNVQPRVEIHLREQVDIIDGTSFLIPHAVMKVRPIGRVA